MNLLAGWVNFYVIVGSSAGALTGLQFVVMTLIAGTQSKGSMHEIRAFGTPTVIHFCAALMTSAIMAVPWPATLPLSCSLTLCGAAGVLYSLFVIRHAIRAAYTPDTEDWIWYVSLPVFAYTMLAVAGGLLFWSSVGPLFLVAATTLLFLTIGIHNAWDTVTYITVQRWQKNAEGKKDN